MEAVRLVDFARTKQKHAAAPKSEASETVRSGGWAKALLATQAAVRRAGGNPERMIQAVAQGALELVPLADGAAVAIREDGSTMLRGARGSFEGAPPSASGLAERALADGRAHLSRDTRRDPLVDGEACGSINAGSMLSVPLPLRCGEEAVLLIVAREAGSLDEDDLLTAELLAGALVSGLATLAHAEAERARAEANKRFVATFEQAGVGLAHVAPDGRFLLVNERFCAITGYSRDALIKGGFQQITYSEDLDGDLEQLADLLAGRTAGYSTEKRYIRADGQLVWVNLTVSLVRHEDGTPDFFVSAIEDISARKAAEQDANHDPLTGLLNRRGLVQRIQRTLERRRGREHAFGLAYLDLDGFKAINDRHGHSEGDRCLVEVAAAMRTALRAEDLVARVGGDEFVILLPCVEIDSAREVLARIEEAIEGASADKGWRLSVSTGAVVVPPDVKLDSARAIAAADELMYRAKLGGGQGPVVELLGDA